MVASFTAQYGLRVSDIKKMRWSEFRSLLVGIGPDTVLGRIVSIRSEEDRDVLKNFTKDQMRIRNEWRLRHTRTMSKKGAKKAIEGMERAFLRMAGLNV
ncbi:Gp15 family bacteriophage protein [Eubacterium segne]|uniref:Gp15 family bacteriophage protein n=1 Tax=Eubacterium segne TaxID=2763045 RepID=UPI003F4FB162